MCIERPTWWYEPEAENPNELTDGEFMEALEFSRMMTEEDEMEHSDWFPNYYAKTIEDFMSDRNKELEFRTFIKEERRKESCKI